MTVQKENASSSMRWPETCILDAEQKWHMPLAQLSERMGGKPELWQFESFFGLLSYLDRPILTNKEPQLLFLNPVNQILRQPEEQIRYLKERDSDSRVRCVFLMPTEVSPERKEQIRTGIQGKVDLIWEGGSDNLGTLGVQVNHMLYPRSRGLGQNG